MKWVKNQESVLSQKEQKKSSKCRSDHLHHMLLRGKIESKAAIRFGNMNVFYNSNKSEQSLRVCEGESLIKIDKERMGNFQLKMAKNAIKFYFFLKLH